MTSDTVDFAIQCIRPDEYQAALAQFPESTPRRMARHPVGYQLSVLPSGRRVAIARQTEQGNGKAQALATAIIDELRPKLLLVVGIAGGFPTGHHTLCDVAVSNRVFDMRLQAALSGGEAQYTIRGGPMDPSLEPVLGLLPSEDRKWAEAAPRLLANAKRPLDQPPPDGASMTVKAILEQAAKRSAPVPVLGGILASDTLVLDSDLSREWHKFTRHGVAIEMESAGVYEACNLVRQPFLAIRAFSDIVSIPRRDGDKYYATHVAAAYARFLVDYLVGNPELFLAPPVPQ